jgi:hypothetical protein
MGKPSSSTIVMDCWHGEFFTVIVASKKFPLRRMSNPSARTVPLMMPSRLLILSCHGP